MNFATAVASYILCVFLVSAVTFVTYGIDKRRARQDRPRVPEKNLHLLSLLGGWPGAYLGQEYFRHKTQKLSFRMLFWLTVIVHLIATLGAFYFVYFSS